MFSLKKRGDATGIEILLGVILMVIIGSTLTYIILLLIGGSSSSAVAEDTMSNFDNLRFTIDKLTKSQAIYDSETSSFFIEDFILVGFDKNSEYVTDICGGNVEVVQKPFDCADLACLCLFVDEGEDTFEDGEEKPTCYPLPDIDYVFTLRYTDGTATFSPNIFNLETAHNRLNQEAIYKNMLGDVKLLHLSERGRTEFYTEQYSDFFLYGQCDDWGSDEDFRTQNLYVEVIRDSAAEKTYLFLAAADTEDIEKRKERLKATYGASIASIKSALSSTRMSRETIVQAIKESEGLLDLKENDPAFLLLEDVPEAHALAARAWNEALFHPYFTLRQVSEANILTNSLNPRSDQLDDYQDLIKRQVIRHADELIAFNPYPLKFADHYFQTLTLAIAAKEELVNPTATDAQTPLIVYYTMLVEEPVRDRTRGIFNIDQELNPQILMFVLENLENSLKEKQSEVNYPSLLANWADLVHKKADTFVDDRTSKDHPSRKKILYLLAASYKDHPTEIDLPPQTPQKDHKNSLRAAELYITILEDYKNSPLLVEQKNNKQTTTDAKELLQEVCNNNIEKKPVNDLCLSVKDKFQLAIEKRKPQPQDYDLSIVDNRQLFQEHMLEYVNDLVAKKKPADALQALFDFRASFYDGSSEVKDLLPTTQTKEDYLLILAIFQRMQEIAIFELNNHELEQQLATGKTELEQKMNTLYPEA